MTLHRKDVRAHYYTCDVCHKREKVHFFHDVDDHLPDGWVLVPRDPACYTHKQKDDDLFLCDDHAKDEKLVHLMLRLVSTREQATA